MSEISFTVPGTPVGKGRPKFARRGNFVTAYTPEKTASYENLVKMYAAQAMNGRLPISSAVRAQVNMAVTVPASWSRVKRQAALIGVERPTTKPDIDNVIKGIFDACNGIVWHDDKQVVWLEVSKKYDEKAYVAVMVHEL